MDSLATTLDLITRGGVITLLIMALIGGMRGWYVWSSTHTKELNDKDSIIDDKNATIAKIEKDRDIVIAKIEKDRDYWRDVALRTLTATEKAVQFADISQQKN